MKKIALILLICMYTFSSFGIGISQFYCCGKLKTTSLSFVHFKTPKCTNQNGMEGCCKTTFKSFQVKDNHVAAAYFSNPVKTFTNVNLSYSTFHISALYSARMHNVFSGNAPPLYYNLPIYKLYCIYLI